jgi:hypothetical protein
MPELSTINGLFDDKHLLISGDASTGRITIERLLVRETVSKVPRFVTTRGGYFFMRRITALRFPAGAG